VSVCGVRLATRGSRAEHAHALAHDPRDLLFRVPPTNTLTLPLSPTRVCSRSEQVQGRGVQVTKSPKGAGRQPRAGLSGGPQFPDNL
jgi:hypothetical protein